VFLLSVFVRENSLLNAKQEIFICLYVFVCVCVACVWLVCGCVWLCAHVCLCACVYACLLRKRLVS